MRTANAKLMLAFVWLAGCGISQANPAPLAPFDAVVAADALVTKTDQLDGVTPHDGAIDSGNDSASIEVLYGNPSLLDPIVTCGLQFSTVKSTEPHTATAVIHRDSQLSRLYVEMTFYADADTSLAYGPSNQLLQTDQTVWLPELFVSPTAPDAFLVAHSSCEQGGTVQVSIQIVVDGCGQYYWVPHWMYVFNLEIACN